MKKLSSTEMRKIDGGRTLKCRYCGQSFSDVYFLWWKLQDASWMLQQHMYAMSWNTRHKG